MKTRVTILAENNCSIPEEFPHELTVKQITKLWQKMLNKLIAEDSDEAKVTVENVEVFD